MKIRHILYVLTILCISGWGPFSYFFHPSNHAPYGTDAWLEEESRIVLTQADNIDPHVLKLGLHAFIKAQQNGLANKRILTIIDYSKPSTMRRLWVIDLKKNTVLYNTWVTHGKNSGNIYATSFSNRTGSLQSSYGVFLTTTQPYVGGQGYSLRLIGLERGINDNAYNRDIVFHGAWYANPRVAKQYGQLGRSWGCPAVDDHLAKPIIDTIKEKSIIFAYANDPRWIKNSPYLNS